MNRSFVWDLGLGFFKNFEDYSDSYVVVTEGPGIYWKFTWLFHKPNGV